MEKKLKSKMSISSEERRKLVELILMKNHGSQVESENWSVYSFRYFPKLDNGKNDYSKYGLYFIAFVDNGETAMPLYFQNESLEKVILWLYEKTGETV